MKRRLITIGLLLVAGGTALLAIPSLHEAARKASSVNPLWLVGEIGPGALGYLGFDIAVLGLTCAAVGRPLGVPAVVLAYVIGYAANSLPVPGGIGVLEGGLVGALLLYGAPVMPATAAVLLYHTIAFWVPSLGGAMAYALTPLVRRAGGGPTAGKPCEGRTRKLASARREPVHAITVQASPAKVS